MAMAPEYDVSDGRILSWALETHVVQHCNLRCAECCTLSPALPTWFADPETLRRDLERAAGALKPHVVKLTGGEPLLHPELLRCLDAVRASGISPRLSVTTNGLLLAAMPDAFYERIDRLTVSHYRSAPLTQALLTRVRAGCHRHGVLLTVKNIDSFQRMDAFPAQTPEQTASTFGACWLRMRCHMLHGGRFYACTRPPHLADRLEASGVAHGIGEDDGVALDEPRLLQRLLAYLQREEPLAACRFCLGAGGGWSEHRQLPRPQAMEAAP
jgi:cyclic pyranopterin phosphate synthase